MHIFARKNQIIAMENEYSLAPLLFVLGALLVGALLKLLLKKSRFPYTVGLFCFGLLVGVLFRNGLLAEEGLLQRAVYQAGNINPDTLLYVFLPVLIFSAAYELDLHTFRKTFVNSSILAIPGVVVSMGLVALLMMGISLIVPEFSGWNWTFALMFGALVSATDPVAVVALLKELNTSKRFSTLVDGESLLNDGTGIVLFMLFFGAFSGETPLCRSPFMEFLVVALGGALLGYLMAVMTIFFITKLKGDEMVQNSVIILSAYVTFILAQGYLQLSGVIALVAFGLEMTYHGKLLFSPKANEFTEKFWDLASFIANTLVFIMVGIIIAVQVNISWISLGVVLGVYLGVNLIRTAVVFLFYPIMKRCGYGLSRRDAVILSWGGLRGALGLTLALMVSATPAIPEDIRSQILLMTAGVVALTLTVNATTIRHMLERPGLTEVPAARSFVDFSVRNRVNEAARRYFEKLSHREAFAGADWEKVSAFLPENEQAPDISACDGTELLHNIRMTIYGTESQLVRQLYADGTISVESYHELINSQERHFDSDGTLPLSDRKYIFRLFEEGRFLRFVRRHPSMNRIMKRWLTRRVVTLSDIGRGFLSLQRDSQDELAALKAADIPEETKRRIFSQLEAEIRENIERMRSCMDRLAEEWPEAYASAMTSKAARMMLCNERKTVRNLTWDGVMSAKDGERCEESIDSRAAKL